MTYPLRYVVRRAGTVHLKQLTAQLVFCLKMRRDDEVKETGEETHWSARIALALLASSPHAMANVPVASADLNYFLTRAADWMGSCAREFGGYMRTLIQARRVEHIMLTTGLVLLAVWGAARFYQAAGSRAAIARFETEAQGPSSVVSALPDPDRGSPVDFSLWSTGRISAYEESLAKNIDSPIAILRIPKIHLEVPVFNDTDDLALDRGVGRILGTAQLGTAGNLGIAGHRDGFFRGLQSVALGDRIEIVRPQQIDSYAVSKTQVVLPENTHVLDPTPVPTLTLVTCFPFYFVGPAPRRYIVTAVLESTRQSGLSADGSSIPEGNNTKNKEIKR